MSEPNGNPGVRGRFASFHQRHPAVHLGVLTFAAVLMAVATALLALGHSEAGLAVLSAGLISFVLWLFPFTATVEAIAPQVAGLGNAMAQTVGPVVRQELERTNSLLAKCKTVGLSMIYSDRKDAVDTFWKEHVQSLERGSELAVVGISLRGWDTTAAYIIERILGNKDRLKFRILLTHPLYSRIRDRQEGQEVGTIATHIVATLEHLTRGGIAKESIKLYKGVPTAFIVASEHSLLIQPYPQQALDSNVTMFTLVAEKDTDGIYEQIKEKNVELPWNSTELSEDYDPCRHGDYLEKARRELII